MALVTGTISCADPTRTFRGVVMARRISPASSTSTGVVQFAATTLSEDGVQLSSGRWMLTWWDGPEASRIVIDVPEGTNSYTLDSLIMDREGGRTGAVRWGASTTETPGSADLATMCPSARYGTSPAGNYEFPAGGFKFLAWPESHGSPTAGGGFKDAVTGLPISMAGDNEGFTSSENGWGFLALVFDGVATRVYRTRQAIGGAITITVS